MTIKMKTNKSMDSSKRKLIKGISVASVWSSPIVTAVILPAHAQTSMMCVTDTTVGGPLSGNPNGATSCQAACEFEAISQNAQLCDVRETTTASGTDCSCDLDLP